MEKITGEFKIREKKFTALQEEIKNLSDLKIKLEEFLKKSTTELLEVILAGGISLEASDLHVEPKEEQAKIRVRIDGILQDVLFFDLKTYQALLSRIKLLSEIKLNITDRPQDGRFSFVVLSIKKNKIIEIEIRTSSLPTEYGESIVLRILNPKSLIEIEGLGLRKDILETFKNEIKKPNGMIIVTGPTGSGKTTTLYAVLKKIQKPEIKIITIEDPIEYRLPGISQTQVNPPKGYDFANGLKSIMRQDPDVILVGEIRDLETAEIALQAALTGHLVLTTLHTNDAAGTIARLVSLGAKSFNIGPALNIAIAQRLVRKVCQKCGGSKKISPDYLRKIKKISRGIPEKIKFPKIDSSLKVAQIKGCQDCNFTGYRGRVGIFEIFSIDDEVEKFILKSPSIAGLKELAGKKGMVSIKEDGIIKVLEGVTTIEELERIVGEL